MILLYPLRTQSFVLTRIPDSVPILVGMSIDELRAALEAQIKETQREIKALERAQHALNGTKPQRRKRRKRKPAAPEPAADLQTTPAQTV